MPRQGGEVGRARWDLLPKDRPEPSLMGLELGSGGEEEHTQERRLLEPGAGVLDSGGCWDSAFQCSALCSYQKVMGWRGWCANSGPWNTPPGFVAAQESPLLGQIAPLSLLGSLQWRVVMVSPQQ